jgi:hypothetical protein
MARLVLPSRLELKRLEGSNEALLARGHLHGILVRLTGQQKSFLSSVKSSHHFRREWEELEKIYTAYGMTLLGSPIETPNRL